MTHAVAVAVVGIVLISVVACATPIGPGAPLRGLSRGQRERFERGRIEFGRVYTPETGLGPLFNADSCAGCHRDPVPGGGGDFIEVHVARFDAASGFCDPLIDQGGPVIQQRATPALAAALGIEGETVPASGAAQGGRSTPDVLGFGLLDAVPDATILALSDPEDADGDGISGRPNRFFDGRIGRFGRKALVPTLREFNVGAFPIHQGVTNSVVDAEESIQGSPIPEGVDPLPEPEVSFQALGWTDAFVRLSAAPQERRLDRVAMHGQELFSRIGCAACHTPVLRTGGNRVKALSHKPVRAYTDLLLHDMGPELADICLGQATPAEFRTEPLMGLALSRRFLHDGRAKSPEEAVRMHGGEAASSRDRFAALSREDREALLAFLGSL